MVQAGAVRAHLQRESHARNTRTQASNTQNAVTEGHKRARWGQARRRCLRVHCARAEKGAAEADRCQPPATGCGTPQQHIQRAHSHSGATARARPPLGWEGRLHGAPSTQKGRHVHRKEPSRQIGPLEGFAEQKAAATHARCSAYGQTVYYTGETLSMRWARAQSRGKATSSAPPARPHRRPQDMHSTEVCRPPLAPRQSMRRAAAGSPTCPPPKRLPVHTKPAPPSTRIEIRRQTARKACWSTHAHAQVLPAGPRRAPKHGGSVFPWQMSMKTGAVRRPGQHVLPRRQTCKASSPAHHAP